MLTQNEAMGAATASDGGHAPIASFWVRIMTSCINIKRGIYRICNTPFATYSFINIGFEALLDEISMY